MVGMQIKKINNFNDLSLIISGTAWLRIKNHCRAVHFHFAARDGMPPSQGDVHGDPDLLEAAWHAGRAELVLFGTKLSVQFTGMNLKNGALTVNAAPVFATLATQIKRAQVRQRTARTTRRQRR